MRTGEQIPETARIRALTERRGETEGAMQIAFARCELAQSRLVAAELAGDPHRIALEHGEWKRTLARLGALSEAHETVCEQIVHELDLLTQSLRCGAESHPDSGANAHPPLPEPPSKDISSDRRDLLWAAARQHPDVLPRP